MQYPLISEYVDAIRSAEDNFDKLSRLRPVLDGKGNPVMSSGNFAVVFKMEDIDTGRLYAVKCFTKEQAEREEAYRQITDELEFVQSPYLAKVRYCDRELFVDTNSSDESEFPVLLMDWVDGTTLDRYVRQNIGDRYALEVLAYNFSRLAMWLLPQSFAHGDLKPDNILVRDDGSLTLVDYDGMFVPAMQGQKSRELGSPDFRHPLRTADDFNEHIDDFPIISILLSLRLIASDQSLLDRYGAADRLLFAESDYRDLSSCRLLKAVFPSQNAEANTLVGLFAIACGHKTLANVSFRLLAVAKPQKPKVIEVEEELSMEVTDEDLKDAIKDEFGVWYSRDGKRLLKGAKFKKYKIKEGTRVICDNAFANCSSLQEISIPQGVTSIGDNAFSGCESLREIIIPRSVKKISGNPFVLCRCKVICNSPHFKIVDGALYDADMTVIISFLSDATKFVIPSSVISIGNSAFSGCESLREITLPKNMNSIGNYAFSDCESLQKISLPKNVTSIGDSTFSGCESLQKISLPKNVTSIGSDAFYICTSLQQITIPQGVTSIGDNAFSGCESLRKIIIPKVCEKIGTNPFEGCKCKVICNSPHFRIVDDVLYNADMTVIISFLSDATRFAIPNGVTSIGDSAFSDCKSLQKLSIPKSMTSIGNYAFSGCESLQRIYIPNGVTSIGNRTFSRCKSLQEISIPSSVTSIGNHVFYGCSLLCKIKIPRGNRKHFGKLLYQYKDKLVEVLKGSIKA